MESIFLLSQNTGRILAPIAKLLGFIMNGIYNFMDDFLHIQNVALTIIIFTVVIYMCLLPLTYKQQKFSKMSQIMNPEIQAVQKKYKGRRDQASMNAMNEETQAIYRKYGVSPSGSCIFMIIQLPILFALYRVIYNVPGYITRVKETFDSVVTNIMSVGGYQDTMNGFLQKVSDHNSVFRGISLNFETADKAYNSIIDVLYKCTSENWHLLRETFGGFGDLIASTQASVEHFNNFLGISIVYSPKTIIGTSFREGQFLFILIAILIPVISAATQFLNLRLMPQATGANGQAEAMAGQMKMMNYMMPIYSFILVFFLPVGVGIYWIAGALIRSIQQFVINRRFDRMDLEKMLKENEAKAKEKMKKRVEKKGVSGETIANAAKISTRNIEAPKRRSMTEKAASVSGKTQSQNQPARKYKEGSMAAKANLVRDFNEKKTK